MSNPLDSGLAVLTLSGEQALYKKEEEKEDRIDRTVVYRLCAIMAFAMFNVSGIIQRLRKIFQRTYSEAKFSQITSRSKDVKMMEKYVHETDILIVGGGPAGLSAAIQARRLAEKHSKELRVTLVENECAIGGLVYSGACLDPIVLNELFPNWKELGAPLNTPVTEDKFAFLTKKRRISIPISKGMCHHGNYIVRLSNMVKWLSEQAEAAGVEIYPKNEVIDILYHEDRSVKGVITYDRDLSPCFDPDMIYSNKNFGKHRELYATCTIFAEGSGYFHCLEDKLRPKFNLRKDCEPHEYGLELRQIWEIEPSKHRPGTMERTIGWPLHRVIYGGSFLYHLNEERPLVVIGFNHAYGNLYGRNDIETLQEHPSIEPTFEGGKIVVSEMVKVVQGGFQSIPKLHFPGGCLIGNMASFVNVLKMNGINYAIKSGILAAESVIEAIIDAESNTSRTKGLEPKTYTDKIKNSWIYKELKAVRNIRPSFNSYLGLYGGLTYSGFSMLVGGREPWTLSHGSKQYYVLSK
ncbi:PREDICTED: electron transfer flavoprotein-ubiquinone oxidoreductase, mitochondrial-like isoform X2 [Wasmannia auropunctata]|uniref:electron transfer flavoprotein-ubiquinone oxidoreductase, mitochondrial-like isoform X2 n=1 Tax=Wasmannia auropunctata TaxID=64793 RepID=UPI0005F04C5D|nr:PREDICTED: electron transfer flavoprotein-ubiquinone oxidoreductase, mitochondrial-like isoform X2 [Wasmannia auropunctata]